MNEWTNGVSEKWMNEGINEWKSEWMNEWVNEYVSEWIVNEWMIINNINTNNKTLYSFPVIFNIQISFNSMNLSWSFRGLYCKLRNLNFIQIYMKYCIISLYLHTQISLFWTTQGQIWTINLLCKVIVWIIYSKLGSDHN